MMGILIKKFFTSGSERSVKAKKNIAALVFLKGVSILVGFILVPMLLHYLSSEKYGIWLTLSSVFGWISFFDIGLGNGLRNRFIEATAKGQKEKIRVYISTTYAALSVIILTVLLVFIAVNPFLNWAKILNTDSTMKDELSTLALIVFIFFCIRFVVSLINTILTADQRPAAANMLDVLGNIMSLILIFLLMRYTGEGSLLHIGIALGLSMTLVPIAASVWFFRKDYAGYSPSIRYIDAKSIKDLMDIGVRFFIMQASFIIVFATNNIIIAQLFGPNDVTSYNIVFKYFSITTMAFNIIITPFWSAYGDAFHRNDIRWIQKATRYLLWTWAAAAGAAIVLFLVSKYAYTLWLGQPFEVSLWLSLIMAVYSIIINWNSIFASFLNGSGKIKLQIYLAIIISIVNIPLAVFLGKGLGVAGVVLASCICLSSGSLLTPIQYLKLVNGTARGIWSK